MQTKSLCVIDLQAHIMTWNVNIENPEMHTEAPSACSPRSEKPPLPHGSHSRRDRVSRLSLSVPSLFSFVSIGIFCFAWSDVVEVAQAFYWNVVQCGRRSAFAYYTQSELSGVCVSECVCDWRRHGGFVAPTAACLAGPVFHQHHVCFLFQKMFLRGVYDAASHDRYSHLYREERRTGRREHAVSNERELVRHDTAPRR